MFWVPLTGGLPVLRGVGSAPADFCKEGVGVSRVDWRRQVSFFVAGTLWSFTKMETLKKRKSFGWISLMYGDRSFAA